VTVDAEAVTFDCWNTLLAPDGPSLPEARLREWLRIGSRAGIAAEEVHGLFATFERRYRAFREAEPRAASAISARRILDEVAPGLPKAARAPLVKAYLGAADLSGVRCAAGAERCLRTLASRGLRLGIVSNVHVTPARVLRRRLDEVGLLGFFEAVCFSDEVGVYKPDPAIFRQTLARLGDPGPDRVVHVGDSRAFDVAPAKRLGMTAVRLREFVDDRAAAGPEADVVIDRLEELEALLRD
jgi:FMN phosphatase YigB (HAD superfamily)